MEPPGAGAYRMPKAPAERRGGTLQKDKKYFYNFISNISFRVRLKIIFILK